VWRNRLLGWTSPANRMSALGTRDKTHIEHNETALDLTADMPRDMDFVPWHFLDAAQLSAHSLSCRPHPKTSTTAGPMQHSKLRPHSIFASALVLKELRDQARSAASPVSGGKQHGIAVERTAEPCGKGQERGDCH